MTPSGLSAISGSSHTQREPQGGCDRALPAPSIRKGVCAAGVVCAVCILHTLSTLLGCYRRLWRCVAADGLMVPGEHGRGYMLLRIDLGLVSLAF